MYLLPNILSNSLLKIWCTALATPNYACMLAHRVLGAQKLMSDLDTFDKQNLEIYTIRQVPSSSGIAVYM